MAKFYVTERETVDNVYEVEAKDAKQALGIVARREMGAPTSTEFVRSSIHCVEDENFNVVYDPK